MMFWLPLLLLSLSHFCFFLFWWGRALALALPLTQERRDRDEGEMKGECRQNLEGFQEFEDSENASVGESQAQL